MKCVFKVFSVTVLWIISENGVVNGVERLGQNGHGQLHTTTSVTAESPSPTFSKAGQNKEDKVQVDSSSDSKTPMNITSLRTLKVGTEELNTPTRGGLTQLLTTKGPEIKTKALAVITKSSPPGTAFTFSKLEILSFKVQRETGKNDVYFLKVIFDESYQYIFHVKVEIEGEDKDVSSLDGFGPKCSVDKVVGPKSATDDIKPDEFGGGIAQASPAQKSAFVPRHEAMTVASSSTLDGNAVIVDADHQLKNQSISS